MTTDPQYGKTFYQQAQATLDQISNAALMTVLSGKIEGRWHPNGFVIFRLGNFQNAEYLFRNIGQELDAADITTLGQLRFHVWPGGVRNTVANHPPTHSHSWWLCSKILTGRYTDTVFPRVNYPSGDDFRYVKYNVDYRNENEANIEPTNDEVFVRTGPTRSREVGDFHLMAPDLFHQNAIDLDSSCSTLLIMSHETPGTDVIIGPNGGTRLSIERRAIDEPEKLLIFDQLSVGAIARTADVIFR